MAPALADGFTLTHFRVAGRRHHHAGEQAGAGGAVAGVGGAGFPRRSGGCAGQEAQGLETHIKAEGSGGRVARAFCFEGH